ncbi:MAG: hypothetical protein P8Z49_08400 [Acidobacteriota bacterium]
MAEQAYRCPGCGRTFSVPAERVPVGGARGRCVGCGCRLTILNAHPEILDLAFADLTQDRRTDTGRDGMTAEQVLHDEVPPPPAPESPLPETTWELRSQNPESQILLRPYTLPEIRQLVLEDRLTEDDLARIQGGDWQPLRAYPALMAAFASKRELEKQRHGDEERCANHPQSAPRWKCPKCQDYLCRECVINRPLIEGGAPHYICKRCESSLTTLASARGLKKIAGFLKGKRR